jgi:hypothetical protein
VRLVDPADRLDAGHETRKLLELRPPVVGLRYRSPDIDRAFYRGHAALLELRADREARRVTATGVG